MRLLFLIAALVLLLLPLHIRWDVLHRERTHAVIRLRFAGLHKAWRLSSLPDAASFSHGRSRKLLQLFRSAKRTRRRLMRWIHLEQLDACILLCTGNAARSALLSGAAQSLACIPAALHRHIRIQVLPAFFQEQTELHARCIICCRAGILLLTALMLLAEGLLRQHQQKARRQYGTSHW